MKSYLSTPALAEKISELKEKRQEGDIWSAEDEQILAFLVELHILRITKIHAENKAKNYRSDF